MKKKLYKSISLVKKKIKNKEFYYFLEVPHVSILIPKVKEKFILVSQKRHPINKNTLEFPSGWIDKNEKPAKAAVRETYEETGYFSLKTPKRIINFYEEPGRLSASVNVYYVDKLKKINKPEKDINVHLLTKKQLLKSIKNKKFNNGTHIAAFFAYLNYSQIN